MVVLSRQRELFLEVELEPPKIYHQVVDEN